MIHLSDNEIIDSIKNNNTRVLNQVYDQYIPMIRHYIISNKGDESDAWDIFQEAILAIFLKIVSENGLQLTCVFRAYLFSICSRMWLKKLSRERKTVNLEDSESLLIELDDSVIEKIEEVDRRKIISKHFTKLEDECRKLLELFYDRVPFKQIAPIMGYMSEEKAKKRKYMCKEELMKSVKSDPHFNEVKF